MSLKPKDSVSNALPSKCTNVPPCAMKVSSICSACLAPRQSVWNESSPKIRKGSLQRGVTLTEHCQAGAISKLGSGLHTSMWTEKEARPSCRATNSKSAITSATGLHSTFRARSHEVQQKYDCSWPPFADFDDYCIRMAVDASPSNRPDPKRQLPNRRSIPLGPQTVPDPERK